MNKDIMREIFPEHVSEVEASRCPFCHKSTEEAKFRDSLSRREFEISGLCQKCQDSVFGE